MVNIHEEFIRSTKTYKSKEKSITEYSELSFCKKPFTCSSGLKKSITEYSELSFCKKPFPCSSGLY